MGQQGVQDRVGGPWSRYVDSSICSLHSGKKALPLLRCAVGDYREAIEVIRLWYRLHLFPDLAASIHFKLKKTT